jgi:hypothetical protein
MGSGAAVKMLGQEIIEFWKSDWSLLGVPPNAYLDEGGVFDGDAVVEDPEKDCVPHKTYQVSGLLVSEQSGDVTHTLEPLIRKWRKQRDFTQVVVTLKPADLPKLQEFVKTNGWKI